MKDGSVDYTPETKIIIDVPSALNFFADPDANKSFIGDQVKDSVNRWNKKYLNKQEVCRRIKEFNFVILLEF